MHNRSPGFNSTARQISALPCCAAPTVSKTKLFNKKKKPPYRRSGWPVSKVHPTHEELNSRMIMSARYISPPNPILLGRELKYRTAASTRRPS